MAHIDEWPEDARDELLNRPMPDFGPAPFVKGAALARRRVAIVSTAGLHRRSDAPFADGSADYRVIPADTPAGEIVMSHVSTNFDRTGFQRELNVVFPIDRLRELAGEGAIGSVAAFHYSFMGATPVERMEGSAREVARLLKGDHVDAVLLVPV
ncbi:MAG: selenoprotein B glycine/betaine/sarcosine/D-proline reductase [Proteobacteria bacterium]|nr:selenoprotein B glycine/betaine/sarcosine/D-proline reductase [Pseudomonadota bacterium]